MRNSPQPSTRAASRYSSGIVRKNCRRRKIANASPSQFGMISGQRRADEVELRPHHVERHDRHLRRQHQRDEHDEEDAVAPAPAQPRERVRDRDARDEQPERGEARVDERVERPAPDRRAREDLDVVAPPERARPELRRQRLVGRHQRRQPDEDDRREEGDRERRSAGCGRRSRSSSRRAPDRARQLARGRRRRCEARPAAPLIASSLVVHASGACRG